MAERNTVVRVQYRRILAVGVASFVGISHVAEAKSPTPTATPAPTDKPTPTQTATPTPDPNACTTVWPQMEIVTLAKGQSPSNNPKVSHAITGHIIDPVSLGDTAHRIDVCAGTWVNVSITDTTGMPTNTADGSLSCNLTGCSGTVNVKEKYQSISADGKDRDTITLLPN
jgi:hypothetical protein